ncbi:MAG: metal-dependent hydrolase, partial [Promethearchaeota archaeon]
MSSFSNEFVIFAGLMAVLADFDVFLHSFKIVRKSKLLAHKGISHSYFAALIISAPAAGIFSLITGNSFLLAWMIGFIFYSLHVTLDALAASKIPLFYPISQKRFRFFIDRAINPILAIISGIILLFYLIIYFVSP